MFRKHDNTARSETGGGESGQTGRMEMPRRVFDVPLGPSAPHATTGGPPLTGRVAVSGETGPVLVHGGESARSDGASERRLVVGAGVALKGDVTGCALLTVDGELEAGAASTDELAIGAEGSFRGSCEVETADIAGRFEGTLTVRGRLLVRASGSVKGDIRFGELEVERGGQIAGNVEANSKGPQLATVAGAGD